ncbi:MAG: hypothetical protein JSS21_01575 [Proteobacteria bacterium]|nr:hypothetical protein [Pseudomonadota bacterium]
MTTLHSFCEDAGCPDGSFVEGLVRGPDRAYYGVTTWGGITGSIWPYTPYGAGVVYRIDAATGRFSILHQFDPALEGSAPSSRLTLGSDGNLYGTLSGGSPGGFGCVFRLSLAGGLTLLHVFAIGDGTNPANPPVQDAQGNWYGTTMYGGVDGGGTVYELTRDGVFKVLHDFTLNERPIHGFSAAAGLVLARDGNFYGTTVGGGSDDGGTIYRITPGGSLTTLHDFAKTSADGVYPVAAMANGPDGALYGATTGIWNGDQFQGAGTVFRITTGGRFSTLYSFFENAPPYSSGPMTPLTLMPDGYFYGVREDDGAANVGTIFRISPAGEYRQVYAFTGQGNGGSYPEAALLRGFDNALYGTTYGGGKYGSGTVFRFAAPASH